MGAGAPMGLPRRLLETGPFPSAAPLLGGPSSWRGASRDRGAGGEAGVGVTESPYRSGRHRVRAEPPVEPEHGTDPPRHRADPLAHGRLGEDPLLEVHGQIGHAAAETRGAEASAFAGEREQTYGSGFERAGLGARIVFGASPAIAAR